MSLGALTILDQMNDPDGPIFLIKATIVGDNTYVTGGSSGLLAKLQALLGSSGLRILDARDAYAAVATRAFHVVYDQVNDKLISRTTSTGAELTTADQSANTYTLMITAG